MKIAIDPGHGAETAGKRSPDGSLLEYEFNRSVAQKLKHHLERHGVEVLLTAEDDHDVPLTERSNIANRAGADYFISIHANAYGEDWNSAGGYEIFVLSLGGKAEELAQKIYAQSVPYLGLKGRGIKTENFAVLRETHMPSVLIEHGFYTNLQEVALLKSPEFRDKCAIADARGVLEQLGIPYAEETQEPLTVEQARILVRDTIGLSDMTMQYLVDDYRWGNDLIIKLARALRK